MKKLITSLFSLIITSALYGMKPKETMSKQNKKFDKIEKRQLQEKNNALLQENNNLLKEIKRQNETIIYQNYISFEHEIILVETHRTAIVDEFAKKAKFEYQNLMRVISHTAIKYDKI